MRIIAITLLLIAAVLPLTAGPGAPAAFVDIGLSRPSAMGGAFVSVADDSNAIFYNPAGIITSPYKDFSFMHTKQKGIIPFNYASFVMPINKLRGVGAAMVVSGDEIFDEKIFILSYAESLSGLIKVVSGISAGVNVKLHFAGFGTDYEAGGEDRIMGSAWGVGADVGLLWIIDEHISAGLMFKDAFSYIVWTTQHSEYNEGVPLTTAVGITYRMKEFLITADLTDIDTIHIGFEKTIFQYVDLRAGYYQTLDVEAYKSYALGIGVSRFQFGQNKSMSAGVDIAYVFERLDNTLKVQVSFKFK